MTDALVALSRTNIEGTLVVVIAMILFAGSTYLLLSAVFGLRMAYLVAATGFFGFMLILSALWSFGAPGTPPFLGPKGDLPTWTPLAAGTELRSPTFPVVDEFPDGEWAAPGEAGKTAELEAVTQAVQEFVAEEANAELAAARIEGEVTSADIQVEEVRFAQVGETELAAAKAFPSTGGREVEVVAYLDPGNLQIPSYIALGISVVGFVIHVPFLDRAERRRKDVLTGGEQPPFLGPA